VPVRATTADTVQGTLENVNWNKYSTDGGQHNYTGFASRSSRWPTEEEERKPSVLNPDQMTLPGM
jgi:hypothetical protein